MPTVVSYSKLKSHVISILQASRTAYAATTDGSKRSFASDTEIFDTILEVDGEVCTLIANTLQHPFQSTFVQTSSALSRGASLPARNGIVLKVTGLNGQNDKTFTEANVNSIDDTVSINSHGFSTGQKIQLANTSGAITGVSDATDYYIINLTSSTVAFALTPYHAGLGTKIEIAAGGGGTATVSLQYIEQIKGKSADQIKQAVVNADLYGIDETSNSISPFFYIEGDILYSTAVYSKVVYTDYTLTSSPQAPEPYTQSIVAGAVSRLLKDGGDMELSQYYGAIYQSHLQEIASRATTVPQFIQ